MFERRDMKVASVFVFFIISFRYVVALTPKIQQIIEPKKIKSPVDVLPEFLGAILPGATLRWSGDCFKNNSGYLYYPRGWNKNSSIAKEVELHIEVYDSSSWYCSDVFIFATPYRVSGDLFFFKGNHKFTITWLNSAERKYVKKKGFSVFRMPKGVFGTLKGMWDVLPLLSNSWVGEAAQLAFLQRRMGAKFVPRSKPWATDMAQYVSPSSSPASSSSLLSGDFIVTSKVRGPWGAFETIQKWVSGSWSGHTAMILRSANGSVFVAESGHYNDEGEPTIALLPFLDWWSDQLLDKSEPHIAILPLHSRLRSVFNESAAWSYAASMVGRKFGYHNIIFSWIDTPEDNFPPPVDSQMVASFVSLWIRMQPDYAGNIFKEALNKRLGTNDLDFPEVLMECERRKISFGELLAVPEQDNWLYTDGLSTSCVAFVVSAWKKSGILGPVSQDIQATEFTIRDAYHLKIFEDDPKKLPLWCHPSASKEKLSICQILGKWKLELPGFNSQEPYPHMNEHCPSMPPKYLRPSDC